MELRHEAQRRTDVDDGRARARLQVRQQRTRQHDRRREIDGDLLGDLLARLARVVHAQVVLDRRVVDHSINGRVIREQGGSKAIDGPDACEVERRRLDM